LLDALIWMVSPVRGLRPVRAARAFTEKVPKPTMDTDPPFFSAPVMAPVNASRARPASALLRPESAAIASISSDLFM
jgi:hypothetical protein